MATNKNAQKRYQILDRCFSNQYRQYTIEDLLDEVNEELRSIGTSVKLRQIRDDIKEMRSYDVFDAPIVAYPLDGRKCYYRYSDPEFSIYKNDLSNQEMNVLRTAIDMLGRYRGMPTNEWLEEVVSNLEYRFGIVPNTENVVSFYQNENLKGLEFLSLVIDAATHHIPLDVLYRAYSGKEIQTVIHPYHVKQYNNRWFLFGQVEGKDRLTNFALDRIVNLPSRRTNRSMLPISRLSCSTSVTNLDVIAVLLVRSFRRLLLKSTSPYHTCRRLKMRCSDLKIIYALLMIRRKTSPSNDSLVVTPL